MSRIAYRCIVFFFSFVALTGTAAADRDAPDRAELLRQWRAASVDLFRWIGEERPGTVVPGDFRDIIVLPLREIRATLCGEAACSYELYEKDGIAFIAETLDPNDVYTQSRMLHELVHVLQYREAGRNAATKDEWLRRECAAYALQQRWLRARPEPRIRTIRLLHGLPCGPRLYD